MDEDLKNIKELHHLWWNVVWSEIAWSENGCEPEDFALTIQDAWDSFKKAAKTAKFDFGILVAEFEAHGDPRIVVDTDYASMVKKTLGCRLGGKSGGTE